MPDPILADIDRRLERIENGIFGNGREGLIHGFDYRGYSLWIF